MSTEEARKALNEMKELVDNYVFDPAKRTYYGIAIDTAINGMTNYEALLNRLLNEERQKLIEAQHDINMQIQQYEMFRQMGGMAND